MNKFEQLIEYVINDEEAKARELFHDIVVEKSRQIYEEMMEEEAVEESEESVEEAKDEDDDKEKMEESEEAVEEGMEEALGGDQADDLIDDIEVEEQGLSMEGEGDEDMADADLEDRVVDLEDKLDELMAEFEALMGGEEGGEEESEVEMDLDTPDMDAEEVVDDEMETEGMMENVDLKAAPKPVTSEEGSVNKKSTVAANAGAKGAMAKPVAAGSAEEKGRPAPAAKDMGGTTSPKQGPATKPHLAQATDVNNKSVIQ